MFSLPLHFLCSDPYSASFKKRFNPVISPFPKPSSSIAQGIKPSIMFPSLYHLSSTNSFPKWQQEESPKPVTLTLNPPEASFWSQEGVLFPSGSFQGTKFFASVYVPASSLSTHLSHVLPTWSSGLESRILMWWLEAWTLRPNSPAESCMILSKLLNVLISFFSKTRAILVPTSGLSSRLWELK